MNGILELNRLVDESKRIEAEVLIVVARVQQAKEKTEAMLNDAAKSGLTKVSIGVAHESIPESVAFPFGASRSIFGIGTPKNNSRDKNGWPAIWGVVERAQVGAGCGNTNQMQADTSGLIDGVYHLRSGRWFKVDK